MKQRTLLALLSEGLEKTLRDDNLWWRGERMFGLPTMRRWAFDPVVTGLKTGLTPVTVLRGPRQIGKTTLLNQVIHGLLDEGVAPNRIFRVQFDELPQLKQVGEPILELSRWFSEQVLGKSLNQAAHDGEQAYILFDEVQNLSDWGPQLKHLVDMNPVRVVVTSSSALRIEAGRDSLAGRIATLEMGPLLLREIAALRGFGTLAGLLPNNGLGVLRDKNFWINLRAQGETNREMRQLAFLDATLLLRLIEPLELRLKRRRGASKLCLCDHALRAAWLQEVIPLSVEGLQQSPHLSDLAGRIAESTAGYFLRSIVGLDVAHFPERAAEPEVDYVLTVGEQRIPLEIKYRKQITHSDTRGLRSFIEKAHYNAPFGILVTLLDESATDDPRIVSLPLSRLMLLR